MPAASVARKVTLVVPSGKVEPEARPRLTIVGEAVQLSVAVAFGKVATAVHAPAAAGSVTDAGQVTTGACVSVTVTAKEQDALLLAASVARKVTLVVPTGNEEPEVRPRLTIAGDAVQLSVAVAFGKVATAVHIPGAAGKVNDAGH